MNMYISFKLIFLLNVREPWVGVRVVKNLFFTWKLRVNV